MPGFRCKPHRGNTVGSCLIYARSSVNKESQKPPSFSLCGSTHDSRLPKLVLLVDRPSNQTHCPANADRVFQLRFRCCIAGHAPVIEKYSPTPVHRAQWGIPPKAEIAILVLQPFFELGYCHTLDFHHLKHEAPKQVVVVEVLVVHCLVPGEHLPALVHNPINKAARGMVLAGIQRGVPPQTLLSFSLLCYFAKPAIEQLDVVTECSNVHISLLRHKFVDSFRLQVCIYLDRDQLQKGSFAHVNARTGNLLHK